MHSKNPFSVNHLTEESLNSEVETVSKGQACSFILISRCSFSSEFDFRNDDRYVVSSAKLILVLQGGSVYLSCTNVRIIIVRVGIRSGSIRPSS